MNTQFHPLIARQWAHTWHGKQRRKYTNEPYIHHCENVVKLVEKVPHTSEMLSAAWLHDVLEDCSEVTEQRMTALVGEKVTEYVRWLTNAPLTAGNRRTRKAIDCERLQAAPDEVKTIKLADVIDNTESIVVYDPEGFGPRYLDEIRELLPALLGGDPHLMFAAQITVGAGYRFLERYNGGARPIL